MNVQDVNNIYLEEDFIFAIALGVESKFTHSAIIYKWDQEIKTIDFFSGKIRSSMSYGDFGNSDYIFVRYNNEAIPEDFAVQIPALCEQIRESNSVLNFGITYNNSTFDFDNNNKLIIEGNDYGITCSTFIITIFESVGISLIESKSWKQRKEDSDWHQSVLDYFRERNKNDNDNFPDSIIEHFNDNLGCFRFRPEEVAAASANSNLPADFAYCSSQGIKLKYAVINGSEFYRSKFGTE